jgi:cyclophilin family peptidyl-prolyl cis-trans isomerase
MSCLKSQEQFPKREMRAVWIATVSNIDWPSKPGLTSEEQKQEFIDILEMHKKNGMNAVIMQIRPCADAFYPSNLEPWSIWLSGEQGKAPEPFYDPLQFMIEETHKRCMEFHAWFNPYRVLMNENTITADNHITKTHPEWLLKYGKKTYFDPALPETRAFVTSVIADVVIERGDPLGSRWGGADYLLPSEDNAQPFERGSLGIATSGFDTGSCQFFICQSEQPHLTGNYTHFGRVIEGMDVVDKILPGDKIINISEIPQ